ncbi:MAG: sulfite exporter TauE/SafE family protein [Bacteroidetes bacterium]|nr:sulfite exporter TauE/SafE family protein [Bacteroidota bacterium]
MREIACYCASLIIGLSLGMIGAGGSILTIPAFVYIARTDPGAATVYSMFVVGLSSLVGGIRAHAKKLVDLKVVALFGTPSVIGVFISRRLIFPAIPDIIFSTPGFILSKNLLLMGSLAIIMLFASVKLLRMQPVIISNNSDREVKRGMLTVQGLFVGMLTGLIGIGGGFLIVPALFFLARLPMKVAIGSALLIITINATFSFLTSFTTVPIDWSLLIKFTAGAAIGILIGTKISEKISGNYLKKIFGCFLLLVSFFIFYKVIHP